VADQAQRSDVLQIAFATALHHRSNVIRIPKRPSANPLQTPAREQFLPMCPARPLQVKISRAAIDPTDRADALVSREYLFPQITWVRAKTPFMDAPIRAERKPARGDLKTAPAAQRPAILALLKGGSNGKPAGHGPRSAHETFLP